MIYHKMLFQEMQEKHDEPWLLILFVRRIVRQ